ncbi:MAG TPA: hypothetical protein VFJ85_18780 [Acidimicrobiales bacterium]|nr:hypothetical protein [Acidimicrobiales bacterium]
MLSEHEIEQSLSRIADALPGFIAAALVDMDSGMTLGYKAVDPEFDLATASAYESEMLKQKVKLLHALGLSTHVEDVLVTLSDQIHLVRVVGPATFLYLAAEKSRSNLAMVRSAVQRHAADLAA